MLLGSAVYASGIQNTCIPQPPLPAEYGIRPRQASGIRNTELRGGPIAFDSNRGRAMVEIRCPQNTFCEACAPRVHLILTGAHLVYPGSYRGGRRCIARRFSGSAANATRFHQRSLHSKQIGPRCDFQRREGRTARAHHAVRTSRCSTCSQPAAALRCVTCCHRRAPEE